MVEERPIPEELSRVYEDRAVCVTGGAGFIGSHICHGLAELGARISVIDDLSAGLRANLDGIDGPLRFIEGSILDRDALAEAVAGCEVIFHEAALTSVPGSVEEPQRYHEVDATGTLRVLEAARDAGVRRVVYAASSSAYGDRGCEPNHEGLTPRPASPYAAAKCAGELYMSAYANAYRLETVSLRYFNIFGPRQQPDSPYAAVIAKFASGLLRGSRLVVFGDGTQTRDFTHVANAVRANLLAGTCTASLHGQIVNVACGRSIALLDLLAVMGETLGVAPDYEHAPPRVGDIMHSSADVTRARELLGYEPIVDLREGLADTLEWYRREHAAAALQS